MKEYHKIQTVYLRDPKTKYKTLLEGQFSLPEFEYLANNKWVFTEKVDGTNIRIQIRNGDFTIAGKTDKAQIPPFLYAKLLEIFVPLKEQLYKIFDTDVCLYGEGYGAKIQKGGGNYRSDQGFVLFDIKIGQWWLRRKDVEDIASKLGLEIVPIIGTGTLFEMVELVKNGFNSAWGNFIAEGIVARPEIELFTRSGKRIITKIKYKDFQSV